MKPLIGITGNNMSFQTPQEAYPFDLDYALGYFSKAIAVAGGIPVIIPITSNNIADDYLSRLDGLIFAGGADISPHYYQEEPHPKLGATSLLRDEMEFNLLKAAMNLSKPILGVCRGLQLINVALGGSLYQDLSQNSDVEIQHNTQAHPKYPSHSIKVMKESYLAKIYPDGALVNSYHHQAIKKLANPLHAVAHSNDGIVEAVEWLDDQQSIIAVQWHPEMNHDFIQESTQLFEDLIIRAQHKLQN